MDHGPIDPDPAEEEEEASSMAQDSDYEYDSDGGAPRPRAPPGRVRARSVPAARAMQRLYALETQRERFDNAALELALEISRIDS